MKLVYFIYLLPICIAILVKSSDATCASGDGFENPTLQKVTCFSDGEFANISCNLITDSAISKRLTIVVTVFKDVFPILRLKQWAKASGNKYIPGLYDIVLDICEVAGNLYSKNDNFGRFFLDTAIPAWRQRFGNLFHTCPYKETLMFNQTITGVPCNWIGGASLFTGKAQKPAATKSEIMFFKQGDDTKKKPNMLITLFDSKN